LQGKELRVAKKRSGGRRRPLEFKKMAVERLKSCDNVVALAEELGVHRRMLYRWRDQLEPMDNGDAPPENVKERDLRIQLATAKRLLADKTLEVDFFRGALQKIEARRQSSTQPGETASTTKSGS
jgi:transposase-like protein